MKDLKNTIFLLAIVSLLAFFLATACQRANPTGPIPETPILDDPLGEGDGEGPDEELPVDPNIYPIYNETYGGGFEWDVEGTIYLWDNSVANEAVSVPSPPEGVEMLKFTVLDLNHWDYWGLGITYTNASKDLSAFSNGHLKFSIMSTDITNLKIGMDSGGTSGYVFITAYGFVNDGNWHHLSVPITDITVQGVDITAIDIVFANLYNNMGAVPENTWVYYIDNIRLTKN